MIIIMPNSTIDLNSSDYEPLGIKTTILELSQPNVDLVGCLLRGNKI